MDVQSISCTDQCIGLDSTNGAICQRLLVFPKQELFFQSTSRRHVKMSIDIEFFVPCSLLIELRTSPVFELTLGDPFTHSAAYYFARNHARGHL